MTINTFRALMDHTREKIQREYGIGRTMFDRLHMLGFVRCWDGVWYLGLDVTEDEFRTQITLLMLECA